MDELKMKDPNDAIDFIFKKAPDYAAAKGRLAELENFKHSLKAIKATESKGSSIAAKEMEAYASQEYQDLCKAIGIATEQTEALRWQLEAAKMRFEAWRTIEASNRNIERMTK
jgi:predicted  nucleic acid-binding Zn-ribbon protein